MDIKKHANVIKDILTAANEHAQKQYFDKHGEPAYCGFAWVEVPVTRTNSKEAKDLMALGFRKSWLPKIVDYRVPQVVGHYGQSMDLKIQGANAMVDELQKLGIKAYVRSRPD